jgi:histidine ammonia-lyase
VETVLGIEMMCAAQALEFLKPLRPGVGVERAYQIVRAAIPPLDTDRYLAPDIERMIQLVHGGSFASIHSELPPR